MVNLGGHRVRGGSQYTMSRPVDRLVEVCVVENDIRALSTELKGDVLEVTLSGGLHDLPADEGRTSERNLLDTTVLADGLTDGVPVSDDKVKDTRGETNFVHHRSGHESGQRSQFGGLHHDGISGSEGGADLPGPHQDCKGGGRSGKKFDEEGEGTHEGSSRG